MKNKMTPKLSGCFLLLAVGFLMLFSPSVSQAQNNSNSSGLKVGTYKIRAKQSWKSYGVKQEEWVTVELRIESIGRNGEVKAYLTLGMEEGKLKGRVDENGAFELTGRTGSEALGFSSFTIKATAEDDSLVEGTYIKAARTDNGSEVKGVFDSASWEE